MKVVYKCDFCEQIFYTENQCTMHEFEHIRNFDIEKACKYIARYSKHSKNICECCKHSYLVYGCELDCEFIRDYSLRCCYWADYPEFEIKPELKRKWIEEYGLKK